MPNGGDPVSSVPEVWLRGPLPGIPPMLMPVAHSLLQVREEIGAAVAPLSGDELWVRPGNAASVGFHLRHLAGSLDRLLTYARGKQLDDQQREALAREDAAGSSAEDATVLIQAVEAAVDQALEQIRATPAETLAEHRQVGRQLLPSTVLGLLFHAAEHGQRHAGQIVTTAKIVRGMKAGANPALTT
jgi:uncharacterized damage-inducible protein DinB